MDRQALESLLQDQAKAPRVTLPDVEANISSINYFTARQGVEGTYKGGIEEDAEIQDGQALGLLTFCVIVAKNGYTFIGSSAVASPENFNREIGQKLAYERAFNEMWAPMGYHLKQTMYEANQPKKETEDWKERLLNESIELSSKIEKLNTFLNEPDPKVVVEGIDRQLLIQQKSTMLEYLEILTDRMLRAGIVK